MSNLNPGGLTRVLNYIKTWVTGLLNDKANSGHTHDDRYYTETLVSYMFSSNEQYKKEAKNFIEWRDQAYAKIFAIIDKFKTDDTYNLPDIGEVFEDIGPIDWNK